MKNHICWEIGDGESIKIWGDNSLPTKGNYKLNHRNNINPSHLQQLSTVNQLIYPNTTNWDNNILKYLFDNSTIKHIKTIKPCNNVIDDKLRWLALIMANSQCHLHSYSFFRINNEPTLINKLHNPLPKHSSNSRK